MLELNFLFFSISSGIELAILMRDATSVRSVAHVSWDDFRN